jgi:hypothetical protein
MLDAVNNGNQDEMLDEKVFQCITNKTIVEAFRQIGSEVQMDKVLYAINHAQARDISIAWLKFHKIELIGKTVKDNNEAIVLDGIVSFSMRAYGKENNCFVRPLSEHVASFVNKAQKSFTSMKMYYAVKAKPFIASHSKSSVLEILKSF